MANHTRVPLRTRFESKYEPVPFCGCWIWTGTCGRNGYGQIARGGTHGGKALAHRVAYELFVGPIPDGMHVMHKCDTVCCVNPDHLKLGTRSDNMQDMIDKRRQKKSTVTNLPLGVKKLPDHMSCTRRYYARAGFGGKYRNSKYFKTPEEAHLAYLELRREMRAEA